MNIKIIAVGKLKEEYRAAEAEFIKRISKFAKVTVVQLKDEQLLPGKEKEALKIEGQNSFHAHFHALIGKSIADELDLLFGPEEALEMQSTDLFITFFADGLTGMIERWITQRGCDEPEIFMAQLRLFFAKVAFEVYRGLDEENTK